MKISVDQTKCCGSGMCVLTDPDLFDQSEDDGTVVVLVDEPPPELEAAVERAVGLCPNGVIRLDADDDPAT